ncbi:hypothetical protein AYK26_07515 [Euryarchaeota archaeon SM23-78]|nr:MAG: hypothetical protein AYK26_07515 [Euryarchaeota archaeon SM23-78]
MKPLIGITIGDQAGIGLEIIEKAIPKVKDICNVRIIGKILPQDTITYGEVNPHYGRLAGEAIREAIDLALHNKIDAIVTAPIHKKAFNLGGWDYPGHTEMLADLTDTKDYAMMLIHKNLRVVHATTHIPLREVFNQLTTERIFITIKVAHNACRQLGIDEPFIAVAGLNPHSSDNGLFGDEEIKIIQPAINKAKEYGFMVVNKPVPADIVFAKPYDCIVAMYHDQGHIPLKTLGFKWGGDGWKSVDGVNVTFGLPIIRTSPDHGVAFGKAGKGTADPTSMISAIEIAVTLAKNRRKYA